MVAIARTLLPPLAFAFLLAGCLGTTPEGIDEPLDEAAALFAPDAPGLWEDPQLFPHPAYDYPTLTHVPEAAPVWWQPPPARALPETITRIEHVATFEDDGTGEAMAVFGRLAVLPNRGGGGVRVVDLTDPTSPKLLSEFEPGMGTRDADIIAYPDGSLVVALATNSRRVPIWNITDPTQPAELAVLETKTVSHTIAVAPGTPILYNANAAGSRPNGLYDPVATTEIYDLSDPANPVLVQDWANGNGCHALSFWFGEKQRAYCAGMEETQIWDLTDPKSPSVIARIPLHHANPALPATAVPPVSFSHTAVVNRDATVLVVGDESIGTRPTSMPACVRGPDIADRTVSGPMGAMWFYDISDETRPRQLAWLSVQPEVVRDREQTSCAAHHGRMVPDAERDLMVIGYYHAGFLLVEFTDPSRPRILDQWLAKSEAIDAWYVNGWIVTGDARHGLDVLVLE